MQPIVDVLGQETGPGMYSVPGASAEEVGEGGLQVHSENFKC